MVAFIEIATNLKQLFCFYSASIQSLDFNHILSKGKLKSSEVKERGTSYNSFRTWAPAVWKRLTKPRFHNTLSASAAGPEIQISSREITFHHQKLTITGWYFMRIHKLWGCKNEVI